MKTKTMHIFNRDDLIRGSFKKPFEDIDGGDLLWPMTDLHMSEFIMFIDNHDSTFPTKIIKNRFSGAVGVIKVKNNKKVKTIEYYLNLPYTREVIQDEDGAFFLKFKELDGCMTCGETLEEAWENADDALYCWLRCAIKDGLNIPEPE